MKLSELSGKKILIAGFGIEGKATFDFLRHAVPTAHIDVTDKTDGKDYLKRQDLYDVAIKSPGIQKREIRIPYTTATNIFFANTKGVTIGVTGTKGKSTTSSLIYGILKEAGLKAHLVGNIGNPMLTELRLEEGKDDIYVCELSSYQLDDIEYSPHIAVFIDFFPEHMDYHGSVDAYWQAKKRIVRFSKPSDYFIYNPTFEKLVGLAHDTKAKSIPYIPDLLFPDSDIPLLGKHNKDNVRAAVTVAKLLGISPEAIHQAVASFHPLPHRLEYIVTFREIAFYDDAISTTPQSTTYAIEAIENVGTIFLGGQDRGYDFADLVKILHIHNIRNLVLFPDSGEKIKALLATYPKGIFTILTTTSMEEAVKFAYTHTPKGYSCLLSTASPSYSIWKNFVEKGNEFQRYIKEYESRAI